MSLAEVRDTSVVDQAMDDLNAWCRENGVRFARASDEDEIFALLAMSHAEIGLFSPDRQKVREVIRMATGRRGGLIGVIEADKRIVACIGMSLGDAFWYTRDQALFELWTFVHPDYRRVNYGKRLIEFSKKCSDWFCRVGTPVSLFSGVVTDQRTEAKCKLYRRQLPKIGEFFLYNVKKKAD